MAIPFWADSPFTWDVLQVVIPGKSAPTEIPGLAKVKAERKYKTDTQNEPGTDGARLAGLGHMPAEVDIVLRIWRADQWKDLQALLPTLLPKPHKSQPVPLTFVHPTLAALAVRRLYITDISAPEETGTKHVFQVTIKATEFLPPNKKNVTLLAKGSNSPPGVAPGLLPGAPQSPADNPSDTKP